MGEELREGNTEKKSEIIIIVDAEWGYLAQLHLLPKCIEKEKVKEVKKLQQHLKYIEQLYCKTSTF